MIAAFTRFDLTSVATTQSRRVLIPLLFVIVFGATLPVPGLPIIIGAVIASVTASYPFQSDERGLLDTLYVTSPVSRRAVVVGRYLTILTFAATAIAIGTVETLVTAAVRHQAVGGALIALMLLVAFAITALALAVQLPWFFALGYTKARPMIYIPVAAIGVIGWIAGQTGLLDNTTVPNITAPAAPLTALVLVVGVALLAASALVSARLYARREF